MVVRDRQGARLVVRRTFSHLPGTTWPPQRNRIATRKLSKLAEAERTLLDHLAHPGFGWPVDWIADGMNRREPVPSREERKRLTSRR